MDKTYLNMCFVDEFGKNYTLRVDDPKEGLDGEAVEQAARGIVESKAFRRKGELTSLMTSDVVKVSTQNLVDHRE
ncbi:MAG: DUF2922 domain-containing protein [Peptoniphilus sp.]|nr:DUF2922 domain-containing protein [Peptoniphilus sp.]MDY6045086.1 DUF2922 domain-containing protein [Peptoniphilus sp.]